MPYLPVDPQDIGCTYEAVIRVNSQSGKSGSAWLIEQNHGLKLPRALQQDFSQHVQQETDNHGKEMTQNALWQLFRARYGLVASPPLALQSYRSDSQQDGQLRLTASVATHGGTRQLEGQWKRFALRRRSRLKPLDQRVVCDQGLSRTYVRRTQRQPLGGLYPLPVRGWDQPLGRGHRQRHGTRVDSGAF